MSARECTTSDSSGIVDFFQGPIMSVSFWLSGPLWAQTKKIDGYFDIPNNIVSLVKLRLTLF